MYFKALRITETPNGTFERDIIHRSIDDLPAGDVLIRVHYSALNYKDGLSATGHKGITKNFPHTPGIEAAGTVEHSLSSKFKPGDEVFITGYDLGMNTSGAFAEYIRVPEEWVIPRPKGLNCKDCMTIGTAGFTAAYALYKMELMGQMPEYGPLVVTGATGGVGSLAVAIFAKAGYEVIAITGKKEATDYLKFLGATHVEPREFVNDCSGRPLARAKWAGALDTVGGNTLSTLIKCCKRDGCVVATGLLSSTKLESAIYPFILNGINLLGIGAGQTPMSLRMKLWNKLMNEWNVTDKLSAIAHEVDLEELKDVYIDAIMEGKTRGRVVVKLYEECCKPQDAMISEVLSGAVLN
ncbi:YhdH/YhfP family quinone oxidoreductase [Chryseosolibacter indicus]|uniref:YhdH/YhfP family quinone oxidoreductase n=1 Tax=Chryseosolibacter indicus TaxID=2782351 RepID=A0ABS5VP02_9BACT|nr:YhdH/YhfP family quinone oxidoreductase [Chryseosolibacter indicus]MBT1702584.1 YhdH/YhfP family quinone oxidoreductase [Chryseosolibacter indicus]